MKGIFSRTQRAQLSPKFENMVVKGCWWTTCALFSAIFWTSTKVPGCEHWLSYLVVDISQDSSPWTPRYLVIDIGQGTWPWPWTSTKVPSPGHWPRDLDVDISQGCGHWPRYLVVEIGQGSTWPWTFAEVSGSDIDQGTWDWTLIRVPGPGHWPKTLDIGQGSWLWKLAEVSGSDIDQGTSPWISAKDSDPGYKPSTWPWTSTKIPGTGHYCPRYLALNIVPAGTLIFRHYVCPEGFPRAGYRDYINIMKPL